MKEKRNVEMKRQMASTIKVNKEQNIEQSRKNVFDMNCNLALRGQQEREQNSLRVREARREHSDERRNRGRMIRAQRDEQTRKRNVDDKVKAYVKVRGQFEKRLKAKVDHAVAAQE